ncbi:dgc domain protein [Rhodopirellula sallentina SM41]|uniref:Dgc domain protein n=1 Tax=Rhodopirellula sallentina SM41 TaxID=1263870 RepID=M5TXQ1_9BACT|nr:dgc domain protein [Rhodopirellula sallentina SM41]
MARELDRRGIAEMSCLAGIGAAKPLFLKKLTDREIWVIDGCPIHCSLGVFGQVQREPDVHIRLHDIGIKKNAAFPDSDHFAAVMEAVIEQVTQQQTEKRQVTQADSIA